MRITLDVELQGDVMNRINEAWFEHGDADRSTDEDKVAWFCADRVDGPLAVTSWEGERMPGMEECSHLVLFEDPCPQCEAEKVRADLFEQMRAAANEYCDGGGCDDPEAEALADAVYAFLALAGH